MYEYIKGYGVAPDFRIRYWVNSNKLGAGKSRSSEYTDEGPIDHSFVGNLIMVLGKIYLFYSIYQMDIAISSQLVSISLYETLITPN